MPRRDRIDIFLSYARADEACAEFLERILDDEEGWQLWRDKRSLAGGEEWAARIDAAIDEAESVIVLWSRRSVGSQRVRAEARRARAAGKLIPVLIDETPPPRGFAQLHAIDLYGWEDIIDIDGASESDAGLERLAETLRRQLGEDELKELLFWYIVFVNTGQRMRCVPSAIRKDAARYFRFMPIADERVDTIRELLDELAEEGWVEVDEDGRYTYS